MNISLTGKAAVVSGGASGIGKAIAFHFAKAGAQVHMLDLNEAESTALEFKKQGNKANGHTVNITDQKAVSRIIENIQAKNPIDILVNCAGVAHVGNLEKTAEADIERLFQVNVKGVYNTMW